MKQNCMTLIELVVCVATFSIPVSAEEGATKARKASVISSVDNFDEADMASPRWQTNSNATAEISSADNGTTVSNVLSVKYSNRSPAPLPLSFRSIILTHRRPPAFGSHSRETLTPLRDVTS